MEQIKNTSASKEQKMALIVLLVYVLVLLTASLFTSLPGAAFINKLGVGGVSGIAMLVLGILNYQGQGLISLQKVFARFDWSLLFLLAVTYPIADLIKNADAGIMPTIMATVKPIVSSLGATPFIIVSMIILGLLTQVTHNIVLGAMFMPFLLPLCQAALVFGHESMERKHAYLYGIMLLIITFIVYSCVGIPLGNVLFAALI